VSLERGILWYILFMKATWSIEFINAKAEKEVMELNAEFKAKFLRVTKLLNEV
jgi:hypothetical protein